jgi:hypothetical protein
MKKIDEKNLFDLTYPQFQTVVVAPSEAPDFLCYIDNEPILGVEITELFKNEGHARLKKISEYGLQLLQSKKYKHRLDKKYINVTTAKIKNPDDNFEKEIPVIFEPGMTAKEIMVCINSTIGKKCKKGKGYLRSAPEIDLIIHDASEIFSSVDRQAIFRTLSLHLDRSLLPSPFREIFLVTKHSGKIIKLPIKLAIFLEDVFIFEKLISEELLQKEQRRPNEIFYVLFYCLEQRGYGYYKVNAENDKVTIIVGSHEYTYALTGKTINWLPFQRSSQEKKYETLSECIADKNAYEVEIGQRFIEERGKISCFVDIFSESEYNQEDAPDLKTVR